MPGAPLQSLPDSRGDDWGRQDVARWRLASRRALQSIEDRWGVLPGWRHHLRNQRRWDSSPLPVDQLSDDAGSDESPVFIFSSTWRSGSTLLQRLLLSSGDAMIWGEPWNRCDLVPRLRESLRPLSAAWPAEGQVVDELEADLDPRPLHHRMVPDLYPPRSDLIAAHRALFLRLYAEPARARGYERWGTKHTRLGGEDAQYLQLLFPKAKIVFLVRDPYESWSSYIALRAQGYERWPDKPIVSPKSFGELWRRRVQSFIEYPNDHLAVLYEELVSDPAVLDRLEKHCELETDRSTLGHRIGRAHGRRSPDSSMRILERAVDPVARDLGYVRPAS